MYIKHILVESESRVIPAHTAKTYSGWDMRIKEHTARQFFWHTTNIDGKIDTCFTNKEGEGAFYKDHFGNVHQTSGTMQFSLAGKSAGQVKRFFRKRFAEEIKGGATIEFRLDF